MTITHSLLEAQFFLRS